MRAPTRRSFLTLLGLAPLAAPAIVAAAAAKPATVRFIGANTRHLGAGRRILLADEIDLYPGFTTQDVLASLQDLPAPAVCAIDDHTPTADRPRTVQRLRPGRCTVEGGGR